MSRFLDQLREIRDEITPGKWTSTYDPVHDVYGIDGKIEVLGEEMPCELAQVYNKGNARAIMILPWLLDDIIRRMENQERQENERHNRAVREDN